MQVAEKLLLCLYFTEISGLVKKGLQLQMLQQLIVAYSEIKSELGFLLNDNIGATTENVVSADFAYNIQFSTNSRLALGLKTSANFTV